MANVYLDKKTDRYYIKINKTTIRRDDNGNFFKTEKQASNFLRKIERNNHYLVKVKQIIHALKLWTISYYHLKKVAQQKEHAQLRNIKSV